MAKSDTPLVAAAAAFDQELATYTPLVELFLKTPLDTLERTATRRSRPPRRIRSMSRRRSSH